MKIEEFGVVIDDLLLWLKEEGIFENPSLDLLMKNDKYAEYIADYFIGRSIQFFDIEVRNLERRTGFDWFNK